MWHFEAQSSHEGVARINYPPPSPKGYIRHIKYSEFKGYHPPPSPKGYIRQIKYSEIKGFSPPPSPEGQIRHIQQSELKGKFRPIEKSIQDSKLGIKKLKSQVATKWAPLLYKYYHVCTN